MLLQRAQTAGQPTSAGWLHGYECTGRSRLRASHSSYLQERRCTRPSYAPSKARTPIHSKRTQAPITCCCASADPSQGDAPYSIELLLATTRLFHLERYREEIKHSFYEQDAPLDLTRCALLICNHPFPQLDHRVYFQKLEEITTRAGLRLMEEVERRERGGFRGLDSSNHMHQLLAVSAINHVLFVEEGYCVNTLDLHDPNNSYLSELMDKKQGNQYSLLVLYMHVAEALGLPVSLVGTGETTLLQLGAPGASAADSTAMRLTPGTSPVSSSSSTSSSAGEVILEVDDWIHSLGLEVDSEGQAGAVGVPPLQLSSTGLEVIQMYQELGLLGDEVSSETASFSSHSSSPAAFAVAAAAAGGGDAVFVIDVAQQGRLYSYQSGSWTGGPTGVSAQGGEGQGEGSGAWGQVSSRWAADAAQKNSWKALYGPGALDPPGSVIGEEGSPGEESSPVESTAGGSTEAEQQPSPSAAAAGDSSSVGYDARGELLVTCLSDEQRLLLGGLQPVSPRQLLVRLLEAIKLPLMLMGWTEEALAVIRYLRATDPFSLPDLRDEALCLNELGRWEEAGQLLSQYLTLAPSAPDAEMALEVLQQVQLRVSLSQVEAAKRRRRGG